MTGWDSNSAKMDYDAEFAVVALVLAVIFAGGFCALEVLNHRYSHFLFESFLLLFLHPFVFCARMRFIQGGS